MKVKVANIYLGQVSVIHQLVKNKTVLEATPELGDVFKFAQAVEYKFNKAK